MAKTGKPQESIAAIIYCEYCANLNFKHIQDFVRWVHDIVVNLILIWYKSLKKSFNFMTLLDIFFK